ncbi:MAG: YlmH/Sll1252 family protein [Clostridiales bacterium]|nr:YlmH/Sll1252 family protein [Clostridiales bacterium]
MISCNPAFSKKLAHRDFLGSVLGLGIERSKIGDIVLNEGSALVFCDEQVAEYVASSLEQVGHTKVKAEITEDASAYIATDEVKETVKTVASERADAVLSSAFNISRGAASEAIKSGKVFANWVPAESGSKKLSEGDVITLRGKGRVKLLEFMGSTKKDKLIIKFQKFN